MRRAHILACLFVLVATLAAQQPQPSAAQATAEPEKSQLCSETHKDLPSCNLAKHDAKLAAKAYDEALKLAGRNDPEAAMDRINDALRLSPRNSDYLGTRELLRHRLVEMWLQRAGQASSAGNEVQALAAYREALEYDPSNAYALAQMQNALPRLPEPPPIPAQSAQSPAVLTPRAGTHNLRFTGRAGDALTMVAAAWGVRARIDDTVVTRTVTFQMDGADWTNAVGTVCHLTHAMMVPLAPDEILFLADTVENRREYDRMVQRTFYPPGITTPQQLNELVSALRVMFELHDVSQSSTEGTISIRAPQSTMQAVSRFMETLQENLPQVMLDIQIYQVSRQFTRHFGLTLPHQFTVFNVPTEAQKVLSGQSLRSIINQLETGTLNLSSLASSLNLTSLQSSPLTSPFLTFGGGLTLTGITLSAAGTNIGMNDSQVRDLQHVTIQASALQPAVVKIGERYPIVNATYSSEYSLPSSLGSLSSLLSGSTANSFNAAYAPSVSYEDLGLDLKATPAIHQHDVRINFELKIRALSGMATNGMPILSSREYTGTITAPDGGSIAIAGYLTDSEQHTLDGYPGLQALNRILGTTSMEKDSDQVLIILTPHIVRSPEPKDVLISVPPASNPAGPVH